MSAQPDWRAVAVRILEQHHRELSADELEFVRSMSLRRHQPNWGQSEWLLEIDRRVSAPGWDGMA
ncbi:hypothetical protein [Sphingomonas agri]|uniref:hypothetical protein n=1 Tax=Sphingomonas agri TaxID=1813878 RepID=UPI00312054E6